jgi:hypothetical protein
VEADRPPRKGQRRADGKSDPIDAEHAARQVLSDQATAQPKLANEVVEAIRLLKLARDTAVKALGTSHKKRSKHGIGRREAMGLVRSGGALRGPTRRERTGGATNEPRAVTFRAGRGKRPGDRDG